MTQLLRQAKSDSRKHIANELSTQLPTRLAHTWVAQGPSWGQDWSRPINETPTAALNALAAHLHNWEITPSGTEGYKKAEATAGGVDTQALSGQTMQSRQPGLYFIGEVVDVTGWLGGYNFQWAWASAYACAQSLAAQHKP
jgi:predicted flavoprotein YhiN